MTDDFSELENNATCYTINNSSSIYAYRNNVRTTYTEIGGRWFKSATQTYTSLPGNAVCIAYSDITKISTYSYMQPVFYAIAFILGILVWSICFWLWSKLIQWRGVRL